MRQRPSQHHCTPSLRLCLPRQRLVVRWRGYVAGALLAALSLLLCTAAVQADDGEPQVMPPDTTNVQTERVLAATAGQPAADAAVLPAGLDAVTGMPALIRDSTALRPADAPDGDLVALAPALPVALVLLVAAALTTAGFVVTLNENKDTIFVNANDLKKIEATLRDWAEEQSAVLGRSAAWLFNQARKFIFSQQPGGTSTPPHPRDTQSSRSIPQSSGTRSVPDITLPPVERIELPPFPTVGSASTAESQLLNDITSFERKANAGQFRSPLNYEIALLGLDGLIARNKMLQVVSASRLAAIRTTLGTLHQVYMQQADWNARRTQLREDIARFKRSAEARLYIRPNDYERAKAWLERLIDRNRQLNAVPAVQLDAILGRLDMLHREYLNTGTKVAPASEITDGPSAVIAPSPPDLGQPRVSGIPQKDGILDRIQDMLPSPEPTFDPNAHPPQSELPHDPPVYKQPSPPTGLDHTIWRSPLGEEEVPHSDNDIAREIAAPDGTATNLSDVRQDSQQDARQDDVQAPVPTTKPGTGEPVVRASELMDLSSIEATVRAWGGDWWELVQNPDTAPTIFLRFSRYNRNKLIGAIRLEPSPTNDTLQIVAAYPNNKAVDWLLLLRALEERPFPHNARLEVFPPTPEAAARYADLGFEPVIGAVGQVLGYSAEGSVALLQQIAEVQPNDPAGSLTVRTATNEDITELAKLGVALPPWALDVGTANEMLVERNGAGRITSIAKLEPSPWDLALQITLYAVAPEAKLSNQMLLAAIVESRARGYNLQVAMTTTDPALIRRLVGFGFSNAESLDRDTYVLDPFPASTLARLLSGNPSSYILGPLEAIELFHRLVPERGGITAGLNQLVVDPGASITLADVGSVPLAGKAWFNVWTHGTTRGTIVEQMPDGTTTYHTAATLAELIKAHPEYHGQWIRLHACNAREMCPPGLYPLAQELANILGVPVLVPDNLLYVMPEHRRLIVGSPRDENKVVQNRGRYRLFKPQKPKP